GGDLYRSQKLLQRFRLGCAVVREEPQPLVVALDIAWLRTAKPDRDRVPEARLVTRTDQLGGLRLAQQLGAAITGRHVNGDDSIRGSRLGGQRGDGSFEVLFPVSGDEYHCDNLAHLFEPTGLCCARVSDTRRLPARGGRKRRSFSPLTRFRRTNRVKRRGSPSF